MMLLVMRAVAIVTVFLHCVGQKYIVGQEPLCQPQPSCSECIRRPGCAWCTQANFLKPGEGNERRCDSRNSLTDRKCTEHVIDPQNELTPKKDTNLNNDPENVVQLKPQNVNIKLRVGVPYVFPIEFKRAQGYPIDLYYLMDLSYSMKDDLEQIKNLGQKILKMLRDKTETVRIGFGSFVDKEMLPYVSMVKVKRNNPCPNRIDNTCQPAFSFQNVLPLTSNAREFQREVSKQKISGNLDSPEAGLDAIMQAVVCKDKIKWGNVTRILVYTSDDTFHMAGDGRLAGVFKPHNGKCHLNENGFYNGRSYDYPSVGHLSRVLQDNNIQLIFAVTEDIYPAYKALGSLIPQSVVGVLKKDSSNVVDLISEAYGNLSSTLVLEEEGAPKELNVSYRSNCNGNQEATKWNEKGECQGIKHEKVTFQVKLEVSECLKGPQNFRIKLQGISEEVKVTVETQCQCACGFPKEFSEHCSGKGNLTCGVCRCPEGYLGQNCECEQQQNSTFSMQASCRPDNSLPVCSGHGSCECGKCVCHGGFSGTFCSCDDKNCELHDSKLCNGKGDCKCGECKCKGNYTGTACECAPGQDNCKHENEICSGQGTCICNHCKCNNGFMGDHCSAFINRCTQFKDCITCHMDGGNTNMCAESCMNGEITRLDGAHELECTYKGTVSYDVKLGPRGKIILHYADLPRYIDKTTIIIGSSVTGIIIIGIVIIIIYRILLELYDIREYQNFVKAQKQTEWNEQMNPLFQGATTTVLNPLHTQDE